MRILLINHYAGSPEYGMEYRPYYLAREWQKAGHHVTIIAGSFSHLRKRQPDPGYEIIAGIIYYWVKTMRYQGNGILRFFSMLQFVLKLFILTKRIIIDSDPDVVIASSTYPLDIYPAYLIAKRNKAKLVFELHDLWPLSPIIIGGYSKYNPFIRLLQRAENFACKKSNCYISLLVNAKNYLIQHGLKDEKFFYIPNGFSIDEMDLGGLPIPAEHQETLIKLKHESKLIIGYAGGHSPSNALKSFILASKKIKSSQNIKFVLVGDGSQKSELIKLSIENNLKNVYFLPPVSKASIPTLLNYFDILYAGGVSSNIHKYGTSFNKITDYMLAEKPIIFAVDEPNSLIETVGCGIKIAAESETELINAIRYISELSVKELKEMGRKGREYALRELNYVSLAKKIIDAVERS